MHILIDECLPKKLKQELREHTVFTVQEKGWSGIENGDLLCIAEKEFDVWLTADRGKEKCLRYLISILKKIVHSLVYSKIEKYVDTLENNNPPSLAGFVTPPFR